MSEEIGSPKEVKRTFGQLLDGIDDTLAKMGVLDLETQRQQTIARLLERAGVDYAQADQAAYKEYGLGKLSLLQEAAVLAKSFFPGIARAFSLRGMATQAVEYFIPAFGPWSPADILGVMRGWDILQVHPDRKWEAVLKLITAGIPFLPTTIAHSYLNENAARRFTIKYLAQVSPDLNETP